MNPSLAGLAGYLIGSLPTAQGLGRLWGVDLLHDGSANPGANNARRLGGLLLGGLVLAVEAGKGAGAVLLGQAAAGDAGALAAGVAAVAGNVWNVWYRFRGGKGLGISAGALAALWPAALVVCLVVIVLALLVTRSSGLSALVTMGALNVIAVGWPLFDWPNAWGVDGTELLIVFSAAVTLIMWRRHWKDWTVKRHARHRSPRPA